MHFKSKKYLGLYALIPAAVFLFHPVVAFLDVLPDCIGYALLYFAMRQVADLNGRIADGLRRVRIMLCISLGALAVELYSYGFFSGNASEMNIYEMPVLILLCSFVMAFFQCYYMVVGYRELFLGLNELAEYHGGSELLHEKQGRTVCERMASYSGIFVVLSSLLSTLPECAVLISFEYEVENAKFDWYAYIELFRTVAGVISLVFGLVWLVRMIRLTCAILRDKPWIESLTAMYTEELLVNPNRLTLRRFRLAFVLLIVGAVFSAHLRMDYVLILPGVVCAVFVFLGVLALGDYAQDRKPLFCSCAVLSVVSVGQMIVSAVYLKNYVPEASAFYPEAYRQFLLLRILEAVESAATLAVFWCLLRLILQLITEHTAIRYDGVSKESRLVSERATERLHKGFWIRTYLTFASFCAAAAANAVESVLQLQVPWLWWPALILSAVAVGFLVSLLFRVLEHLQLQFSSERTYKH